MARRAKLRLGFTVVNARARASVRVVKQLTHSCRRVPLGGHGRSLAVAR